MENVRRSLRGAARVGLAQLLAIAAAAVLCAPAAARPGFARPIFTQLADYAGAIATADFNGDGHADLAVAGPHAVSVLLGKGDGTFRQGPSFSCCTSGMIIAAGDLNGDGHPDLVFSDPVDGHALAVELGNGDGSFHAMPSITAEQSSSLSSLVLADLNGDGHPDVAATNPGIPELDVWLGSGNGTFAGPSRLPFWGKSNPQLPKPVSIASADFNRDGRADLLIGQGFDQLYGYSPAVQVLLGNGDGTFTAGPKTALPTDAGPFALRDFTGNGQLDLAIADGAQGLLLPSAGAGVFGPSKNIVADMSVLNLRELASADFDLDGRPDVAMSSLNGVDVALERPGGKFQQLVDYPLGATSSALAVGDFNGDGKPDIVAGTPGPGGHGSAVAVLLNTHGLKFPVPALSAGKRCYQFPRDHARISAGGFPAGDTVTTAQSRWLVDPATLHVGANGSATARLKLYAPFGGPPQKVVVSVSDVQDDTVTARTSFLLVRLSGRVSGPTSVLVHPSTRYTYDFYGFPPGSTVYGHYLLQGKLLQRTVRMGKVAGPCGDLRVKVRSWPVRNPVSEAWTVQFDDAKAYHSKTADKLRFLWIMQ